MKYILNENIALRGWRLVPFAYYTKHGSAAAGLSAEEYFFLSACDGKTEIDGSAEEKYIKKFTENGFIAPAKEGDSLSEWQKPRYCDNRYFPKTSWVITGKCNYNCKHCFMAKDNAHNMTYFTRDEWMKTLDDLDRCGVQYVTLTGGEPLLHPDFMDIVREISRRGMTLRHLNTNGALITQQMLDEFKSLGVRPLMKISFDCLGHHDWMRGVEGAEKQAIAAIDLCIENGFPVYVQTCIHRLNIDSLYDTAVFLAKKGVVEMRVIRTTEAPRWEENAGDACFGIEEYYERILEFTEKYAATGLPMTIDAWQVLHMYPTSKTYHYRPVTGGCHSFRPSLPVCGDNRGTVCINSDGNLVPCIKMAGYFDKVERRLGNAKTDDLQKILQESKYLDAATCTVAQLHEHTKECAECEYRKLCAGGCRAIALALTHDYLGKDLAKCLYFKKGYMQKTDEVFERVAQKTGIVYRNTDDIHE